MLEESKWSKNPVIQARDGRDLDRKRGKGGVKDRILVLGVMPTALANGLVMGCEKKTEGKDDHNSFGLSS